jgi:serine protease
MVRLPSRNSRFSWKNPQGQSTSVSGASKRRQLLRGLERLEDRRLMTAELMPLELGVGPTGGQELPQDRVPGEVVIGFRPGVGADEIRGLAQAHGLTKLQSLYMGGDQRLVKNATLPPQAVDAVLRALQHHPLVEYAERDVTASTFLVPNDSLFNAQWHLQSASGSINVAAAWDVTNGSGVTVAVLDTGIAFENRSDSTGTYFVAPDLVGTHFVPGYDFINNDRFANDDHSHGTHVAGTIAQSTNNSIGTAGVAFGASLMPVKVLGRDGGGTHSTIAQGIRWAADNGAHIINLSLGSSNGSKTLHDAVAYAYGKGVTLIAAAGNSGANAVSFPAAYDNYVIAVSATRLDEAIAPYSNYGSSISLAAPGGDLSVDQNRDGYADGVLQNTFNPNTKNTGDFGYYFFQGTSMAAPHVSGVAALVASQLLQKTGVADPAVVRSILESTARDKGPAGKDIYFGHGIVDAAAAVRAAVALTNSAPVARPDTATTNQDQAVVIHVLANDSDPDGDSFSLVSVTAAANGTTVRNSNGTVTYTPRLGFSGTDSFSYTIADVHGATSTAAVTVTVGAAAASPTMNVADLAGRVATQRNQWRAEVTALVRDGSNQPVSGATLTGRWSDGRTATGTTNAQGQVTLVSAWQSSRTNSVTFTVTGITHSSFTYNASANSDVDGDSDGTRIIVGKDGTTTFSSDAPQFSPPAGEADDALPIPQQTDALPQLPEQVRSAPYQNPLNRFNVDNHPQGIVSPFDALLVINHISRLGSGELSAPTQAVMHFVDVDGDNRVTPFDALQIINHLRQVGQTHSAGGEAESIFATASSEQSSGERSADLPQPQLESREDALARRPVAPPIGRPEFSLDRLVRPVELPARPSDLPDQALTNRSERALAGRPADPRETPRPLTPARPDHAQRDQLLAEVSPQWLAETELDILAAAFH